MNSFRNDLSRFDRRRFLGQAAGCAAGLAIGTKVFGAPVDSDPDAKEPWQQRLSGSTINFASLPVEEAIGRLAGVGLEAVDIWSAHAGCPHLDDVLNRLGPEGLQEVLDANKVKLFSFSVYSGGYPRYAELLGKLGGGVAIHGSAGRCTPEELTARMKEFFERLKPEIELAEKYDSYVAIENHGGALLTSLDSMKAFVELNPSKRLGIALAPYHVQGGGESVEEAIRICGEQLLYIYAWQRAPGTGQLPGIGPTDCLPWITALAEINYAGYVNPFMHHEPEPDVMAEALKESCDYLRQCHAKVIAGKGS